MVGVGIVGWWVLYVGCLALIGPMSCLAVRSSRCGCSLGGFLHRVPPSFPTHLFLLYVLSSRSLHHRHTAPVVWLNGDSGQSVAQKWNSTVNNWFSVTKEFGANGNPPGLDSRPSVIFDSLTTPAYVQFDGVKDALQLDQTTAVLLRPLTIFLVDR
jgi:hypothetical protein